MTNGPFRGRDAIARGLVTREQLRSAIWRRLFRDIYVVATAADTHLLRVKGAVLLLPEGAVISGRSAALAWGARHVDYDGPVEVVSPRRFGPVQGLAIRQGSLDGSERRDRWGMPMAVPARAAWNIARSLPELEAVAWVDALAHARSLTCEQLNGEAARHAGQPGSVRASKTLAICDPRAESPPESRLRVHILRSDLPAAEPQFPIMVAGEFVARVDLAWPRLRFALEYDGQWHVGRQQLTADRRRIRAINAAGWFVYPVTNSDMRDIDALLVDIRRALRLRAREIAGKSF